MTIFKISSEKVPVERQAATKRAVYMGAAAFVIALLAGGSSMLGGADLRHLFYWLTTHMFLLALYVLYVIRRTNKSLDDVYSSFTLSVDESSWTRTQNNTPTVTIMRSDMKRIEELQGQGLRICTDRRNRNIWVPSEIENYEALRKELLAQGLPFETKTHYWGRTYLKFAVLMVLVVVQALSQSKYLVFCSSLFLAGYLFAIFFTYYRSPNITNKIRRRYLVVACGGLFLLYRAASVLRP
jgi:hypothetical protein